MNTASLLRLRVKRRLQHHQEDMPTAIGKELAVGKVPIKSERCWKKFQFCQVPTWSVKKVKFESSGVQGRNLSFPLQIRTRKGILLGHSPCSVDDVTVPCLATVRVSKNSKTAFPWQFISNLVGCFKFLVLCKVSRTHKMLTAHASRYKDSSSICLI